MPNLSQIFPLRTPNQHGTRAFTMNAPQWKISLHAGLLSLALAIMFFMAPLSAGAGQYQPAYYSVTSTANYRPVDRPGTQRRVAQTDAEEKARKLIYDYVGSMRIADGRTVNDLIARDARLKALVLEIIRNSETYDWCVTPSRASVQVWVRLDINKIRVALGQCGY